VYAVDRGGSDGGTVRRVPVQVLERNPTVAAVTADLRAGDLIAVINLDALGDGAAVTFPRVSGGNPRGGG
jgi:hypothetical protein